MKTNFRISLATTGLGICYLIDGYDKMFYFLAIVSVYFLIRIKKYNIASCLIRSLIGLSILLTYLYFGQLELNADLIVLAISLSLNSAMIYELIYCNKKDDVYYDMLFKKISLLFVLLLLMAFIMPEKYIDLGIYPAGKFSLITLVIVIFVPYIISSQFAFMFKNTFKVLKCNHV